MPAVVAVPQIVDVLLVQFSDFFLNEPARHHFAEYRIGLFVAERRSVGDATLFAGATAPLGEGGLGRKRWRQRGLLDTPPAHLDNSRRGARIAAHN